MKPIVYVLCVLSLIISEGQTRVHCLKPDFNHNSIDHLCGLRYQPFVFVIQYPNKCFIKPLANKTIFNVRGRAVSDWPIVESRIGGGRNVEYRESPWTIQIVETTGHTLTKTLLQPVCAGSLLNDHWIITAGHCFDVKRELSFVAGSDDFIGKTRYNKRFQLTNWRSDYKYILHPKYKEYNKSDPTYDIALVRVDIPFDKTVNDGLNHFIINNVCLPTNDSAIPYNPSIPYKPQYMGTVFGFGRIGMDCDNGPGIYADIMQTVDMVFKYYFKGKMFCAPLEGNRTCPGDSGSGLVQYTDKFRTRAVLMGAVKGPLYNPKNETIATCFTVVHRFLDWIRENIDK